MKIFKGVTNDGKIVQGALKEKTQAGIISLAELKGISCNMVEKYWGEN